MPIPTLITIFSLALVVYLLKERKDALSTIKTLTDKDKELRTREIDLKVKEHIEKNEKTIREDAIKNSRSTIRGQSVEKFIPLHESFKSYCPSDARFLGMPVDYVIFNGVSDILDGKKNTLVSITFLDVKTGKATLTKAQKKIKEAVELGRVEWKTIQIANENPKPTIEDATQTCQENPKTIV